jgi:predicted O-methyltransferase YrrM
MTPQKAITALSLIDNSVTEYCEACSGTEPEICIRVRKAAESHPKAHWISGPLVGSLLQILIKMLRAKHILDIGTFFGYSAAYMAVTARDVLVTTVDINIEHSNRAAEILSQDPVGEQITFVTDKIENWLLQNSNSFDMIFFDSDKHEVDRLYAPLIRILNPGGVLVLDNALGRKKVIEPVSQWQVSTDRFNRQAAMDESVLSTLLPVRDGLLLVLKPAYD